MVKRIEKESQFGSPAASAAGPATVGLGTVGLGIMGLVVAALGFASLVLGPVPVLLVAAGSVAGLVAWTLTEYGAHGFLMHRVGGRGPAAKEHLMHHAQPERTRPFIRTLGHLGMYSGAAVAAVLVALILPAALAVGLAGGWAIGYTLYESLHWLAHHRPPRGEFDLRLRRRHFHHHFSQPRTNLGVMFSGWDQLFGTNVEPGCIKVPRRLAMSWLTDAAGEVLPEFGDQYVIVGQRDRSGTQDADDIARAFADQALALD